MSDIDCRWPADRVAVGRSVLALAPAAVAAATSAAAAEASRRPPRRAARSTGRPDDLQLARLHRPGNERHRCRLRKSSGVKVNYIEDVNDNNQFFGKMQPLLEQGESGGRSLFVVTDWMAKQMYDLGYLQDINPLDLPTVDKNLIAQIATRPSTRIASSRSPGRAA